MKKKYSESKLTIVHCKRIRTFHFGHFYNKKLVLTLICVCLVAGNVGELFTLGKTWWWCSMRENFAEKECATRAIRASKHSRYGEYTLSILELNYEKIFFIFKFTFFQLKKFEILIEKFSSFGD